MSNSLGSPTFNNRQRLWKDESLNGTSFNGTSFNGEVCRFAGYWLQSGHCCVFPTMKIESNYHFVIWFPTISQHQYFWISWKTYLIKISFALPVYIGIYSMKSWNRNFHNMIRKTIDIAKMDFQLKHIKRQNVT